MCKVWRGGDDYNYYAVYPKVTGKDTATVGGDLLILHELIDTGDIIRLVWKETTSGITDPLDPNFFAGGLGTRFFNCGPDSGVAPYPKPSPPP